MESNISMEDMSITSKNRTGTPLAGLSDIESLDINPHITQALQEELSNSLHSLDRSSRHQSEGHDGLATLGEHQAGDQQMSMSYGHSSVKERSASFFRVGRVVIIPWFDLIKKTYSNDTATHLYIDHADTTPHRFLQERYFVVLRTYAHHCIALAILTHGQPGSAFSRVKSQFGIIYTGRKAPFPTFEEEPVAGESGMQPIPIRVLPDRNNDALPPSSRLNYAKLYTIEFNVPARSFGIISRSHRQPWIAQFRTVFNLNTEDYPDQNSNGISSQAQNGGDRTLDNTRLRTKARPAEEDSDQSDVEIHDSNNDEDDGFPTEEDEIDDLEYRSANDEDDEDEEVVNEEGILHANPDTARLAIQRLLKTRPDLTKEQAIKMLRSLIDRRQDFVNQSAQN